VPVQSIRADRAVSAAITVTQGQSCPLFTETPPSTDSTQRAGPIPRKLFKMPLDSALEAVSRRSTPSEPHNRSKAHPNWRKGGALSM